MSEERTQKWRKSAYLRPEKWPEAIPPMGPKREYGPYPWGEKVHNDPHDLDEYPNYHPDAGSCGEIYLGDVCPYCGVPLRWDAKVVLITGRKGVFADINEVDDPIPAYHPECWNERQATKSSLKNTTLTSYL